MQCNSSTRFIDLLKNLVDQPPRKLSTYKLLVGMLKCIRIRIENYVYKKAKS